MQTGPEEIEKKAEDASAGEKREEMEVVAEEKPPQSPPTPMRELLEAVSAFQAAVVQLEARSVRRVVMCLCWNIRKKLSPVPLSEVFARFLSEELNAPLQNILREFGAPGLPSRARTPPSRDLSAFLSLSLVLYSMDQRDYGAASRLCASLVQTFCAEKRAVVASLQSQIYFYYSRIHELSSELSLSSIRPALLSALQTASLRRDPELRVVLLNLLLRNYLHYNLYEPAIRLHTHSPIQETEISSPQYARFLYYVARIKAIQLQTQQSRQLLQVALRKVPHSRGKKFRLEVTKLLIVVDLSLGLIPPRSLFHQHTGFRRQLQRYQELIQIVQKGDMSSFQTFIRNQYHFFRLDRTLSLVQRLFHTVIKTGIRKIAMAYSRIPIRTICKKLSLDDVHEVEFMVAKSIRDEVIDAVIIHDQENGMILQSTKTAEIYASEEPQEFFHERIQFFLQSYKNSITAMKFPSKHPQIVENEEERKARVRAFQDLHRLGDHGEDEDEDGPLNE